MGHKETPSLLTLPTDVFLRMIDIEDVDVASLIKLSWTCRKLNTYLRNSRSLWHMIVQKQLYNELIPNGSLPLSEMTASQLLSCATRKLRFFHSIRQSRDVYCRRIDVHLSISDGPEYSHFSVDELQSAKLVPGGRYILGLLKGPGSLLICCWDIYIPPTRHGTLLPVTTLLLPNTGTFSFFMITYAPGRSIQDGTFPFALLKMVAGHSEISVLQLNTSLPQAPYFSLVVTREWGRDMMPSSVVGDWLLSDPRCAMVTPWGIIALLEVNTTVGQPAEDGNHSETLALTVTPFRVGTNIPMGPTAPLKTDNLAQDHIVIPEVSHSSLTFPTSRIYSTAGAKYTLGLVGEQVMHSARESRFFIEDIRWFPPPYKAWEQRRFSIDYPFKLSCSYAATTSRNPADITEWHTGLYHWDSPSRSKLSASGRPRKPAVRRFFSATEKIFRRQAAGFHTPVPQDTPSPPPVPNGGAIIEPQETSLTSSLVDEGDWSADGYQTAYSGYDDLPPIHFSARTYDGRSLIGALQIDFCARSGKWLYIRPTYSERRPLPASSGKCLTLVILKFD
ncbi:hypothetical protein DL93DRAFT_418140 [Clavulina sp. PMI_390]|nr:hypothetical protein DL93DRAFT_418140 [Clavulina sp. PMI_390]